MYAQVCRGAHMSVSVYTHVMCACSVCIGRVCVHAHVCVLCVLYVCVQLFVHLCACAPMSTM